jgi:CHAT domain-containing protein
VPDGAVVVDETVQLSRQPTSDTAARSLIVDDDSIIVAFADEQLTDVSLKLSAVDEDGKALDSVEVENHLAGAGTEIAALDVPEDARVTIRLDGTPDGISPGKVHLRVRQYRKAAQSQAEFQAQVRSAQAWSVATRSNMRPDSFRKSGLPNIDAAIAGLESSHGDAALAAEAHLVKANLLNYYNADSREARAAAQRAAHAFATLPKPDALNVARARYIEALALIEMSFDSDSVNPTAAEAGKLAAASLEALADSPEFGPIERARVIGTQGDLVRDMTGAAGASRRYEQARAIYQAAGHVAGERDMRFALAAVPVREGRFSEAASAFDPLLPEIDRIKDPETRVTNYLSAARAQSLSNRLDAGLSLMLRALPLAREYQLKNHEAVALQGLAIIYRNVGDFQQAIAFSDEALKILGTQKDTQDYSFALQQAASVARAGGSVDRACELARESLRVSSLPITLARNHLELAQCYRLKDDIPAAIAEYRAGLAVNLGNPRHHAHTDGKMRLAETLLELPNNTPKDRAEASSLIAEALQISTAVHDQLRMIQARRIQGQINLQLGRTREALADFNAALELAADWRSQSTSSDVRSSMTENEQFAFRGLLDIALANVAKRPAGELRPAAPGELAALLRLERARQRSFGALRVGALDAAATERVDELLQTMAQKSLRIASLVNQKLTGEQQGELQSLQLDMARLHAELDDVRVTAAAKTAQRAETSAPERQTWRVLAAGSAQLSYAFGEKHVYVLVRTPAGTRVARLEPSREALEKQLATLAQLDTRTAAREFESALEPISGVLLPAGLLPGESRAIEIVAEGRIASVPFVALRSPTDAKRRLVETHDVAMVTTLLGVDAAPRQKGSRPYRFVALASGYGAYRDAAGIDPTPKLHAATKEINAAAALFSAREPLAKIKLFSGSDGNAAAVRDIWASGADVVHFATHALADLRQPVASLLVLPATDANGKPTYLTAGQVQSWRGDTELVFLSACESAIGPPQYAAGMPGLQRAFLRAGARGVIATLAPIEDVMAQQFAEEFYGRYTRGMPAAQALSETQRAWLTPAPGIDAADQLRRRMTALSHAYFSG